jgi:hypothetical protein
MSVWDKLTYLMNEAGVEKKAAQKAGGAQRQRGKEVGGGFEIEMGPEEDIEEILTSTASERDNTKLDIEGWNKKIEAFLNGLRKVRKDAPEIIARFRNVEKKMARSDNAEEFRYHEYYYGSTWDNHIVNVLRQAGDAGLAIGLRNKLKNQVLQKRATPDQQKGLPGAPDMSKTFTSKADVERQSPEFQAFEEWLKEQFPTMYPDQIMNDEAWDEAMHWFASSGDQGPNWKYLYNLYQKGGPEGDRLFKSLKRRYDQSIETKSQRRTDYDKTKSDIEQDNPEAIALYNPQAIQMDKTKAPEQDPEQLKKKFTQTPSDQEKRKFPTWWDFGFKGNIPFSDM